MKILTIAAATVLLASSTAAFAQTYGGPQYSAVGGGAAGSGSSVNGIVDNGVGTVVQGATGVVGGVTNVVGGIASVPGQVLFGRTAYEGQPYATPCTVTGGGAVGTCNSVR